MRGLNHAPPLLQRRRVQRLDLRRVHLLRTRGLSQVLRRLPQRRKVLLLRMRGLKQAPRLPLQRLNAHLPRTRALERIAARLLRRLRMHGVEQIVV